MNKVILLTWWAVCALELAAAEPVLVTQYEQQSSSARLTAVLYDGKPAIAVQFFGTDDLHYYADPQTAPTPELMLNATGRTPRLQFGDTLFPQPSRFFDSSANREIDVYVGDFTILLPITTYPSDAETVTVTVQLSGIACTSKLCLPPFEKTLTAEVDFSTVSVWPPADFTPAESKQASGLSAASVDKKIQPQSATEIVLMLLLAVLAGLAFNIMPCVLPVLPLIASRMLNIAKEQPARRMALGLMFCAGIASFFIAVGIFSAALRLTTGAVFNLSDPYRYAGFDIGMVVFLVVFAMFMFDILPLTLPSSVSGKTTDASTFSGSFGMGFLAAILSIPCSGAILAAVLIWVQAQHWLMGFWAFLLMGVGMALPYAALVLSPKLLSRIPRPGQWMDLFKKAMGFAMLLLAIKPLSALPKERVLAVATYAVIAAFAVWMWGTWVSYASPALKKWLVRGLAILVAGAAGFWLLPAGQHLIDWQPYDRAQIQQAVDRDRPVLIKFTADWCTNCKILESRVFQDPEVADFLKQRNVLPVKADTTLADFSAAKDLQDVYGIPGTVPMTILRLPGRADQPVRLSGIYNKQDLLDALKSLEKQP